jgi:hypothetical protein
MFFGFPIPTYPDRNLAMNAITGGGATPPFWPSI